MFLSILTTEGRLWSKSGGCLECGTGKWTCVLEQRSPLCFKITRCSRSVKERHFKVFWVKKKTTKKRRSWRQGYDEARSAFLWTSAKQEGIWSQTLLQTMQGQGLNIKDVGFFKLKVKLNRKKKRFLLSQFVSGGLCTNSDVYSWTLHLIKQNPLAPLPPPPHHFFLSKSQHNHFKYAVISSA